MISFDAVKRSLLEIIDSRLSRTDYHAHYPARVEGQNADGSLELKPDDTKLPGMGNVPIRLGVPGITVKVKTGARVLVGFEGGDPKAPIATLWGLAEVAEFLGVATTSMKLDTPDLTLGTAGALPVARQGEMVMVGSPTMTVSFVTPAGVQPGMPLISGTPYPMFFQDLNPAGGGVPSPGVLYGQVVSGNRGVKA